MAHTLIPPTRPHGYAGYPPSYDHLGAQDTVMFHRRPNGRAGVPAQRWGPPAAAQQPAGPWGVPNGVPVPWMMPPNAGKGRKAQRWFIAGGAAAVVAAAVVAVVAATGSSQPTAPRTVHVPAPPVKSSTAPQTPTATPTPNSGPSAGVPVSDSALPALVPSISAVSQVMGSDGMVAIDKLDGRGTFTDESNPPECVGTILPATRAAYSGSPVGSSYVQALHDRDPDQVHTVFDAVTTFSTAPAAAAFVTQQSITWAGCQAAPVVLDPNEEKPMTWTIQDVTRQGDTLTANTSLRGADASCQRALTAKRNVVIDVTACSEDPANTAVTLTSMIAERIGQAT